MLQIKLNIIRSCIFAVCILIAPAFCSAAEKTYIAESYFLSIEGVSYGFLNSVKGGAISSEVIDVKQGSQTSPKKQLGPVKYEDLTVELGIPVSAEMSNWIAASWTGQESPKDCVITRLDHNFQAKSANQYLGSLITGITIPACDGSSKEPDYLIATLSPERVKSVQGSTPAVSLGSTMGNKKKWERANFLLEINGLDCTKVAKIDSFTVTQKSITENTGNAMIPQTHPGELSFPNLRITIPESFAQAWKDWFNNFVIMGNNNDTMEKSGTLTLLSDNRIDKLLQIKFEHMGIFRLETITEKGSEAQVVVDLYCERMTFAPESAAGVSDTGTGQGSIPFDDGSRKTSSSGQSPIIGLWKVTEGDTSNQYIYMYQEGGKIAGMWNDRMIITGSMNGNVFKGEYHGTVNPNGSAITMTLADDGLSFEGTYVHGGKNYPIRGIKNTDGTTKIKATPTSGASDADFGGTWGTTAGNIIITQEGTKVKGTWEDKTVTGKVEGNVLNGRYYSTRYPEMIWDYNMTMRPDGKTCILFHTKQGGVLINTWRK